MRKIFLLMLLTSSVTSFAWGVQKWSGEAAALKLRQKQETQTLKVKQRYAKSLLKNSALPKAVRIQLRHQLKREREKLRLRQRDQRQALKDRQRVLELETKQSGMESAVIS